jgi:hypothetical protein
MPHFKTWSQDNLVKFAHDAYLKMQEQQDRIAQLQNELKDVKTIGPLFVYEPRMPREWVGLTDAEVLEFTRASWGVGVTASEFIRDIEAKLKKKNG